VANVYPSSLASKAFENICVSLSRSPYPQSSGSSRLTLPSIEPAINEGASLISCYQPIMHFNTMFEKLSMESSQVLRPWIIAAMFLTMFGGHAVGQTIAPLLPTQSGLNKHHMSPLGKPCLTTVGHAKAELANKNIYQHLIKAANGCGQNIKVRVCYYQTQDCVLMNVPPWENKTAILGIFPALKRFRFETKEQF
jgi:hypothetical protein